MTLAAMLAILTPIHNPASVIGWDKEAEIFQRVAQDYHLDERQTKLLVVLRRCENGPQGCEFGVGSDDANHPARRVSSDPEASVELQAMYAAGSIGRRCPAATDLEAFMRRWNPGGWRQELSNINKIMEAK